MPEIELFRLTASSELSPGGIHYAFEPLPNLVSALRRKYADRANVIIGDIAVSKAAGTTTFHANEDHPGLSGIKRRGDVSENDRVQLIHVKTNRLDAVLPPGHRIDVLKVDVEGAEFPECRLRVPLLENFYRGGGSLTRDELVHQVEAGLNFYFAACP